MSIIKKSSLGAAALAFSLAAISCSDTSSEETSASATTSAPETGMSAAAAPSAAASQKGELTFHSDFGAAMAESQQTGKPIVTIFSASWCAPCQMMKKSVYPSPEVAPYHDKFVWAYLDTDKPANQSIAKEHGVRGIPHISYVSPAGEKLGTTVGGRSATEFSGILAGVLQK